MEDSRIVNLYLNRDEQAVACAQARYGADCEAIARRILGDRQDAEECVNAAWLAAWNSIPPQEPRNLKGYLAKLVRRISLDVCRKRDALKRGGGERAAALEELGDCLPGGETVEARMENRMLTESIQAFLNLLPETERRVFLLRYWHLYGIGEIAEKTGFSQSKVASMLFRTRIKLKNRMMKEGLL